LPTTLLFAKVQFVICASEFWPRKIPPACCPVVWFEKVVPVMVSGAAS